MKKFCILSCTSKQQFVHENRKMPGRRCSAHKEDQKVVWHSQNYPTSRADQIHAPTFPGGFFTDWAAFLQVWPTTRVRAGRCVDMSSAVARFCRETSAKRPQIWWDISGPDPILQRRTPAN